MTQPALIINYGAIVTAALVAFFFGYLWYGPLFGKAWAKAMDISMSKKPNAKFLIKALGFQLLGLLLMSYVLAHNGQVWRPSVWGVGADEGSDFMWGLMCAFFTWIGFFVPQQLGKVSWEGRSWKLFAINVAHDFLNLLIISEILAHWR